MKEASFPSPTARRFVNAEAPCESVPAKTGGLAVEQAAPGNESEGCTNDGPLPSTKSLILKAMYYWVVSRR